VIQIYRSGSSERTRLVNMLSHQPLSVRGSDALCSRFDLGSNTAGRRRSLPNSLSNGRRTFDWTVNRRERIWDAYSGEIN